MTIQLWPFRYVGVVQVSLLVQPRWSLVRTTPRTYAHFSTVAGSPKSHCWLNLLPSKSFHENDHGRWHVPFLPQTPDLKCCSCCTYWWKTLILELQRVVIDAELRLVNGEGYEQESLAANFKQTSEGVIINLSLSDGIYTNSTKV